jgi:adenylate cyclase
VDVGTIITVGVLGQAALLIGMGYWGAERIVGTLASSVHRADHQRVEDRIRAFLNRGVAVARTMAAARPWRRPAATAPPRPS